jgi:hypothetical protein
MVIDDVPLRYKNLEFLQTFKDFNLKSIDLIGSLPFILFIAIPANEQLEELLPDQMLCNKTIVIFVKKFF